MWSPDIPSLTIKCCFVYLETQDWFFIGRMTCLSDISCGLYVLANPLTNHEFPKDEFHTKELMHCDWRSYTWPQVLLAPSLTFWIADHSGVSHTMDELWTSLLDTQQFPKQIKHMVCRMPLCMKLLPSVSGHSNMLGSIVLAIDRKGIMSLVMGNGKPKEFLTPQKNDRESWKKIRDSFTAISLREKKTVEAPAMVSTVDLVMFL